MPIFTYSYFSAKLKVFTKVSDSNITDAEMQLALSEFEQLLACMMQSAVTRLILAHSRLFLDEMSRIFLIYIIICLHTAL